tara:strand:+ start:36365 stop:36994 length:630 start_codon:yes stop_codon:yes gene_type:complete
MKSLLSFIIFLTLPILSFAQASDSTKKNIFLKVNNATSGFYNPAINSYSGGSFPSYFFRIGEDGKSTNIGFTGSKLRPHLIGNLEALAELDRFKKKKNGIVAGLGVFALGGVLTAVIGVNEGTGKFTRDFQTGEQIEKQKIKPGGIFGIGVMLTGIVITGVSGNGATKHVVRAVEIYNNGIAPKTSQLKISISPRINYSTLGGGITLAW